MNKKIIRITKWRILLESISDIFHIYRLIRLCIAIAIIYSLNEFFLHSDINIIIPIIAGYLLGWQSKLMSKNIIIDKINWSAFNENQQNVVSWIVATYAWNKHNCNPTLIQSEFINDIIDTGDVSRENILKFVRED